MRFNVQLREICEIKLLYPFAVNFLFYNLVPAASVSYFFADAYLELTLTQTSSPTEFRA